MRCYFFSAFCKCFENMNVCIEMFPMFLWGRRSNRLTEGTHALLCINIHFPTGAVCLFCSLKVTPVLSMHQLFRPFITIFTVAGWISPLWNSICTDWLQSVPLFCCLTARASCHCGQRAPKVLPSTTGCFWFLLVRLSSLCRCLPLSHFSLWVWVTAN